MDKEGEEIAKNDYTLPNFIQFLKGPARGTCIELTGMEVASMVIAYNLKRKSNNLISRALVLSMAELATNIRSRRVTSYRELLVKHCLHHETIEPVNFKDKALCRIIEINEELTAAGKVISQCKGRRNLFTEAYLGILNTKGITQEQINSHLKEPIIKLLQSEYHEIFFSNKENLSTLLRKVASHPREDDNPYYINTVNKYADIAALAA